MIATLAETRIDGVPILLMQSQHCWCVVYGMGHTLHTDSHGAWKRYTDALHHAATTIGLFEEEEEFSL